MLPPKRLLLGILTGLWIGTFQSLGQSPFAPLEGYASDGVLSSDVQMPIYKPRKESIEAQMPIYKPRKRAPFAPGSEDTAGARILRPPP